MLPIPITDEQAKAIQAAFGFADHSLEAARDVGKYLAWMLGSAPQDLAGLLGGDWLRARRVENLARLGKRTAERIEEIGIEDPQPATLAIVIPILRAAADEDRPELVDLWARLLARAMDPAQRSRGRRQYAETIGKMDPLDAFVFQRLLRNGATNEGRMTPQWATELGVSPDQISISLQNLGTLGCVRATSGSNSVELTAYGRELLAAVS